MDIDTIIENSPASILQGIAQRLKEQRLHRNLTQKAFASRAGVGYDAYRRFELTGEITLRNLILCAITLDMADQFDDLFTRKTYQSLEELINEPETSRRKRGSANG